MSSPSLNTKQLIRIAALATIVGGVIVIAMLPTKRAIETLDMQRVTSANTLEAAIEQYMLHEGTQRGGTIISPIEL